MLHHAACFLFSCYAVRTYAETFYCPRLTDEVKYQAVPKNDCLFTYLLIQRYNRFAVLAYLRSVRNRNRNAPSSASSLVYLGQQ